jgi:hypothetical protein
MDIKEIGVKLKRKFLLAGVFGLQCVNIINNRDKHKCCFLDWGIYGGYGN